MLRRQPIAEAGGTRAGESDRGASHALQGCTEPLLLETMPAAGVFLQIDPAGSLKNTFRVDFARLQKQYLCKTVKMTQKHIMV